MLLFIGLPFWVNGQAGGERSFEFMVVPSTPKLTALGGVNVSNYGSDPGLVFYNPALSGDTLNGIAQVNYLDYFADINAGSFAYQHNFGKGGAFLVGANFFGYGTIELTDASGNSNGTFNANESVFFINKSHRVRNFNVGANLKFISSTIANFSASALALDLGGLFIHPEQDLTIGIAIQNLGVILEDYDIQDSKLPFDVQVGTTFKPQYMPFRFSITAYKLYKDDLTYFNPNAPGVQDEPGSLDKIFRRVVVGTELLLSKNVIIRVGYNHLVRQELKLEQTAGGAGFSYGFSFRVKAFDISYARGGYHPAGGAHHFGIIVNTNRIIKK